MKNNLKVMNLQALNRVHVAILCPEGAATTILLNCLAGLGGHHVCAEPIMQRTGAPLVLTAGKAPESQMTVAMARMFDVPRKAWEDWTGVTYNPLRMYLMGEVLERKCPVMTEEGGN